MPFGLKNAEAAYCRLVQRMIDMLGVEGVLAYLDELLIHTDDLENCKIVTTCFSGPPGVGHYAEC